MYWLNLDWIVGNWMPLAIAVVLGFILGWLLTGLSPARRAREYEARVTELESKYRKADRDLADLRRESDPLRTRLTTLQADLDQERARVAELKASVAALEEERAALLEEKEAWEERVAAQRQSTVNGHDAAEPAVVQPAEGTEPADEQAQALETGIEPSSLAALTPDQIGQGFAAVARSHKVEGPSEQEVALRHAYSVISELEHKLEEVNQALSARSAELEAARAEALAATAARHEIETRLVRAREDVASELAVLASTMIKMKDDALARADARVAALNAELDAIRSGAHSSSLTTAD